MNRFNRRAAARIAGVTVLLVAIVAPLAWWVARANAESEVVSLAVEESNRLLRHYGAADWSAANAAVAAQVAVMNLSGGFFDIAEIYDAGGAKLAESLTPLGESVEKLMPNHGRPAYAAASYESLTVGADHWALRVFIPLRSPTSQQLSGYFEGVRIVPAWQRQSVQAAAVKLAAIVGLSALLCGAAIYPIVVTLSAENERKTLEVLDSHISMMEALGRAIAKRDSDTGAHNYRVAWIAARIGEEFGLTGSAMQALIAGSFLHDVGKIGIADAILLKPARLDDAEMALMRTHVSQGEEIVTGMGWLDGANEVVAGHHEKWDGTGYPRRLAGEAIPLSARIFAVADVFDALSSKRPYKEPLPFGQVMQILRQDSGRHFDPAVMAVFERLSEEIGQALQGSTEHSARQLLEAQIRKHFAQ
ncbi:HD domain-containing protein [Inhella sp. 4Y17]|uniref:HD domain-containing protein n=2 Tax=Inhella gelatinilytica TaxID=2795030 RepID=A0A931NEI8_9BURK|nr:HD domain-containing protein [Inhella gelatinilytica]